VLARLDHVFRLGLIRCENPHFGAFFMNIKQASGSWWTTTIETPHDQVKWSGLGSPCPMVIQSIRLGYTGQ